MGRIEEREGNRTPHIKSKQIVHGGTSPVTISEVDMNKTIVINNPRTRERGSVYLASSTSLARYGDVSFSYCQIIEYY